MPLAASGRFGESLSKIETLRAITLVAFFIGKDRGVFENE
jgi:hypothetical protein